MNEEKIQNEDFEKLKKIGIEQIKKDTKLDVVRISDILEKRFEKFDYVRAKGFINILEKEYKLDLSHWLEEYHLSNSAINNESNSQEIQDIQCKQLSQKKQIFIGIGIGIICLIIFICFHLLKNNAPNQTPQPKQEASTHQPLNIQNNPSSLEINHDTPMQESAKAQQESTQSDMQTETKTQTTQSPFVGKSISELGSPIFNDLVITQESFLSLGFERPIWVGSIELESKKKAAQTQEEYLFPLDKDMLFYIAYGSFILSIDDKEKRYKTYNPIFLIYTQEGGLKQLTKDEYLFINGGHEW